MIFATVLDNVFYSNKVINEVGAAAYKTAIEEALENSNDEGELEKMFKGVYQGTKAYYE